MNLKWTIVLWRWFGRDLTQKEVYVTIIRPSRKIRGMRLHTRRGDHPRHALTRRVLFELIFTFPVRCLPGLWRQSLLKQQRNRRLPASLCGLRECLGGTPTLLEPANRPNQEPQPGNNYCQPRKTARGVVDARVGCNLEGVATEAGKIECNFVTCAVELLAESSNFQRRRIVKDLVTV